MRQFGDGGQRFQNSNNYRPFRPSAHLIADCGLPIADRLRFVRHRANQLRTALAKRWR
jgi:hypothetical protein